MKPNFFTIFSALSLALSLAAVVMWVKSYSGPQWVSDPVTGLSLVAPPHAIQLPIPSDAEEFLVPLHGNLERWEYASWERKWYRLNRGIPNALPVTALLLAPAVWLITAATRRLSSGVSAPRGRGG